MTNREFDTRQKSKSIQLRRTEERKTVGLKTQRDLSPRRDPLLQVISRTGNISSASAHASLLKRVMMGQSSLAGQPLLQLQRQYGNRYVQRVLALARKGTGEAEAAPELEQSIQQARGGGQALDSKVCGQMEPTFGADFSGVRIHADTHADTLNRQLNAHAFTTGQDIFIRQGAYNPGASSGRELLAHELTHVVQQNGEKVQRKLTVGQPGDKYEQEADKVARAIMQQEQQPVQRESDEGLMRRQIEEEEEEVQMKSEYSRVQRQVEEEEETLQARGVLGPICKATSNLESRIQALRGSGSAMDSSVLVQMERVQQNMLKLQLEQASASQSDAFCPENSAPNASSANFSLAEFRCSDGTDVPERFRGNVQQVMNNLDVLRTQLDNNPITINSGYRTPAYNQSIGGATQSRHMCGQAADIRVGNHTPTEVADTIEDLITSGSIQEGGLGRYPSFVHYDVRGTRSRW